MSNHSLKLLLNGAGAHRPKKISPRLRGVRVPTLVGFFGREKAPTEVGTLTPVNRERRRFPKNARQMGSFKYNAARVSNLSPEEVKKTSSSEISPMLEE